jgi:hypothetical protein
MKLKRNISRTFEKENRIKMFQQTVKISSFIAFQKQTEFFATQTFANDLLMVFLCIKFI